MYHHDRDQERIKLITKPGPRPTLTELLADPSIPTPHLFDRDRRTRQALEDYNHYTDPSGRWGMISENSREQIDNIYRGQKSLTEKMEEEMGNLMALKLMMLAKIKEKTKKDGDMKAKGDKEGGAHAEGKEKKEDAVETEAGDDDKKDEEDEKE